ncbi:DNA-binding MarR family transcriptional regulator [Paenibacillus amylolyticus]|uniref:DNA-binding MarR family transcriptional regulator n=1 Tax=Paenibacillus amylolyticus TaxID=1451 RepID=A0AAP5H2U5_PAEAM|nr:MarR family transcriptional regulator [Paenibacillus amylolyticus]MDR6723074.1 DNA-binding MarR family transcriptional regulator [Paenibacillus amylolyticus]
MTQTVPQHQVNDALFSFLQSIYLFEQREVERFHVDWNEVYLLQLLIRYPGMRISEISNRMRVKDFVTSRMVTKLEKAGLANRITSKTDKRVVEVFITSEGRAKIQSIEDFNYSTVSSSLHHYTPEQIHMLLHTIGQLDTLLNLKPEGEDQHDHNHTKS